MELVGDCKGPVEDTATKGISINGAHRQIAVKGRETSKGTEPRILKRIGWIGRRVGKVGIPNIVALVEQNGFAEKRGNHGGIGLGPRNGGESSRCVQVHSGNDYSITVGSTSDSEFNLLPQDKVHDISIGQGRCDVRNSFTIEGTLDVIGQEDGAFASLGFENKDILAVDLDARKVEGRSD